MNQSRRVVFGQVVDTGFHHDIFIFFVTEFPDSALGFAIDHAFQWTTRFGNLIVERTGNDSFLANRQLNHHSRVRPALFGDRKHSQWHPLDRRFVGNWRSAFGYRFSLLIVNFCRYCRLVIDVDVVVSVNDIGSVVVDDGLRPRRPGKPSSNCGPSCWAPTPIARVPIPIGMIMPTGIVKARVDPVVVAEWSIIDIRPIVSNRVDIVLAVEVNTVAGVDIDITRIDSIATKLVSDVCFVANIKAIVVSTKTRAIYRPRVVAWQIKKIPNVAWRRTRRRQIRTVVVATEIRPIRWNVRPFPTDVTG
ncbi:MAG: hypothetical protein ACI87E_001347 [Mariniblastus sp.]